MGYIPKLHDSPAIHMDRLGDELPNLHESRTAIGDEKRLYLLLRDGTAIWFREDQLVEIGTNNVDGTAWYKLKVRVK